MEDSENKPTEKKTEGLLATAARAIGKAAGTVASTVVSPAAVQESAPAPATARAPAAVKIPKLPKSNKTRLPRKEKKAMQKAHLAGKHA